ncbi:hypothetical protein JOQ06_015308 [Pogonophryne albipinna]|uniref:TGF-beta propeptide domain-containing protein n=1 Tax=Pogonophryne albipinna TaxID=1090488 RepID=A0AAD6FBM0_9TELE|nr:hypothetical protein JOQ06_015308 [Pogonophryne albipinna]
MKVVKRVCLLLSCWTLLFLHPVLGSLSRPTGGGRAGRTPAAGRQPVLGAWKPSPVSPARITRIRAGPPLIKGETTGIKSKITAPAASPPRSAVVPVNRAGIPSVLLLAHRGKRWGRFPLLSCAPGLRREPCSRWSPPHDYMLSLYWSLSTGDLNSSALHEAGLANTITSFVDRGQDERGPQLRRQRYHFNVSSLDRDGLLGAELRILRKRLSDPRRASMGSQASEGGGGGASSPCLKLYTCASGKQPAVLLQTKTSGDLLGGGAFSSKWEVFDGWKVFKGFKTQQNQHSQQLCFELEALEHRGGRPLDLRSLGFARPGRTNKEKAFFLALAKARSEISSTMRSKRRSGHDNKTSTSTWLRSAECAELPLQGGLRNLCRPSLRASW